MKEWYFRVIDAEFPDQNAVLSTSATSLEQALESLQDVYAGCTLVPMDDKDGQEYDEMFYGGLRERLLDPDLM